MLVFEVNHFFLCLIILLFYLHFKFQYLILYISRYKLVFNIILKFE